MAKKKNKGDVCWYDIDSKRKTPIAYSTVATSYLISVLAEQHETIQDVYEAIRYDPEAKAIMREYIKRGHGKKVAKRYFCS
jgi:hypothetical protein